MWIKFLILFQLIFFEDYKIQYEEYIKNKEKCYILKERLEKIGKEVDFYESKKEIEKAKKLLKESHSLSIEFTNCQKDLKIKEKKLEKLKKKAREELEKEIEKIISSKVSSKENYSSLIDLIEKLKYLKEESYCSVFSIKEIEISEEEPEEIIKEKLKILESILFDIKKEMENTKTIVEKLSKEKDLSENLFQFMKKMEMEGGALLDTRISSESISFEIERIDKEIENCNKTLNIYKSIVEYLEIKREDIFKRSKK